MLSQCGMGLGALSLPGLLDVASAENAKSSNPLLPKSSHFPVKAKHVIHIFANGGPSQVDTWDPKPALATYAGKEMPGGSPRTERKTGSIYPCPV